MANQPSDLQKIFKEFSYLEDMEGEDEFYQLPDPVGEETPEDRNVRRLLNENYKLQYKIFRLKQALKEEGHEKQFFQEKLEETNNRLLVALNGVRVALNGNPLYEAIVTIERAVSSLQSRINDLILAAKEETIGK